MMEGCRQKVMAEEVAGQSLVPGGRAQEGVGRVQ